MCKFKEANFFFSFFISSVDLTVHVKLTLDVTLDFENVLWNVFFFSSFLYEWERLLSCLLLTFSCTHTKIWFSGCALLESTEPRSLCFFCFRLREDFPPLETDPGHSRHPAHLPPKHNQRGSQVQSSALLLWCQSVITSPLIFFSFFYLKWAANRKRRLSFFISSLKVKSSWILAPGVGI